MAVIGAEVHLTFTGRNNFLKMEVWRQSGSAQTPLTIKLVTVNACCSLRRHRVTQAIYIAIPLKTKV